jgi:hypothetical protein
VKLDTDTHKEMHSILTLKLGVIHTDSPYPGNPSLSSSCVGSAAASDPWLIDGFLCSACDVRWPVARFCTRLVARGIASSERRSQAMAAFFSFFLFFSTTKIGDESNLGSSLFIL